MIYNTTNNLDSSIYLKSSFEKNFIGDNYYIFNLQEKRSEQWRFRSNVIDIDEEKEKQINYSYNPPIYTPIEAVIQTSKDDNGKDMGDDWKLLSFEKFDYDSRIGKRYRFSLDFNEFPKMSEEEKNKKSSIWLTVNKNSNSIGNNILVQRCNSALTFVGSNSLNEGQIKIIECHQEPCVLQTNMNYVNLYYNQILNLPQADCYAIMQLNYYTNFIKVNDRFFIGKADNVDKENNHIFLVKAINKFQEDKTTFGSINNKGIDDIPLIYVAFDKTALSDNDDIENRIAERTTVYLAKNELELNDRIYLKIENSNDNILLLNQEQIYTCNAYRNGKILDADIVFEANLPVDDQENYYDFGKISKNQFIVRNKKSCNKVNLIITCFYNNKMIDFPIKLGGFY